MDPTDLDDLTALGRRRRLPRGSTLFTEGEPGDRVVLVLSGRVKVYGYVDARGFPKQFVLDEVYVFELN